MGMLRMRAGRVNGVLEEEIEEMTRDDEYYEG